MSGCRCHMDLSEDLRVLQRRLSRARRPSPVAGEAATSLGGQTEEEAAASTACPWGPCRKKAVPVVTGVGRCAILCLKSLCWSECFGRERCSGHGSTWRLTERGKKVARRARRSLHAVRRCLLGKRSRRGRARPQPSSCGSKTVFVQRRARRGDRAEVVSSVNGTNHLQTVRFGSVPTACSL